MPKLRVLKYLSAYTIPATVAIAFTQHGGWSYLPLLYSFAFIPFLELLLGGNARNLKGLEKELTASDPWYDYWLYAVVPLQYAFLGWFVYSLQEPGISTFTAVGRITSLGMLCGVMGINVAHELGHRPQRFPQMMAKALLLTSLYSHFYIEHNYGHHRNVGTPQDPATPRYNEPLYLFWLRSVGGSYRHAWQIQQQLLKSSKRSFWSLKNDMLWYEVLKIALLAGVYALAGWWVLLGYVTAALIGILLLETVNYIEHYGLERQKVSAHRYENTRPQHSWNSDHYVGRMVLFELTRHSDHHAHPHKKYQVLEHFDESPQLPTGYPGMMLLSSIPPLWFKVMNPRCAAK